MKFKFCPNCGKDAVVQEDHTKYACTNCDFVFWNNPRATVSVMIIKDNKLLFSKRGIEPRKGKYDFPGGFTEYGETAEEACVREINEETGLNINENKLQLLTTYGSEYIPGVYVIDLVFVLKDFEGEPIPADDSAALEWKPFEFVESDQFIEYYPDVLPKLKAFLKQ